MQYRGSVRTAKHKELHCDVATHVTTARRAAFGSENYRPQPSIESSEEYCPLSNQAIGISTTIRGQTSAENECGQFLLTPESREKRLGSVDISSYRPIKRRQSPWARPFRRSPSPKKYRISSSLWSPYQEEQLLGGSSPPSGSLPLARCSDYSLQDWHDQPSPYKKKFCDEMHKTKVRGPSLQVLLARWDSYSGAKREGVRSYATGADHDNPSAYAVNQAGRKANTTSLVTPSDTPGGIELGRCGRGDDDDPQKPSGHYQKSTHDESDSSIFHSDDSKERRRKGAVRKGKGRMSDKSIPVLDREPSEEDSPNIDDMYGPVRDLIPQGQAVAADPSPLSSSPPSNPSEASEPGHNSYIADLANTTAPSDSVSVTIESTDNWLDDRLDTLRATSPPRARIPEIGRLRRHSIATPTNEQSIPSTDEQSTQNPDEQTRAGTDEQPTRSTELPRRPSMLERYLEHGHHRDDSPYPSIALEGAGSQSGMPTSAELNGTLKARVAPGVDGVVPILTGRLSEASESPSRDAAFPGPPGHRRHSAGRTLSCADGHDASDNTSEDPRGRSRVCGLSASCADVCEESQSREGWRESELVPASIITKEPPAHPLWIDEKRPKYYKSRDLDPSVGYGSYSDGPRPSGSADLCDLNQDRKSPAAEELIVTYNTRAKPTTVNSNVHTSASIDAKANLDDNTTEQTESVLFPNPSVPATINNPGYLLPDSPRYQLEDRPRYQLEDPSSPSYADTQVVENTEAAVCGFSSQAVSYNRGPDSGTEESLRDTQVVDFALNSLSPSTNSRDVALPLAAHLPANTDESWGIGNKPTDVLHVGRVRPSSNAGPWARPLVAMDSEPPCPSFSDWVALGPQVNAISPEVPTTATATGANIMAPESTTSGVTRNAERSFRRRASATTTDRRRSLISYILPCLNSNDTETVRSYSPDRGRQKERSDFGSFSTVNDTRRPSICVPRRSRSPSMSPEPLPDASLVGDGNADARNASIDPGTTGPWLTP